MEVCFLLEFEGVEEGGSCRKGALKGGHIPSNLRVSSTEVRLYL